MSKKVVNITELTEGISEIAQLKKENESLYKTIIVLRKELKEKMEKLSHMEGLMVKTIPVFTNIAPEEEICELQLQLLRETSKNRELTLEETKKFDILIKNKRLSQEQSTINMQSTRNVRDISEAQLLQIAESSENDPTENK